MSGLLGEKHQRSIIRSSDVSKIMQILEKMESPHEDEFTDDVNGGNALDKDKVIAARRLEMQFFKKMGVFEKGRQEGSTQFGRQDHHNKMVDTDKGHGGYRSILVGCEFKRDKRLDLCAPTPPFGDSEAARCVLCKKAKGRRNRRELASLTSVALTFTRHANVSYSLRGDEHRVGRLKLSLYGTRDAAQYWAAACTKYLLSLGFEKGRASRCNFLHKGRDIRLTVHVDDLLVVADAEQLAWLDVKLRQQYDMKSEVLCPEANMKQEVRILNRTIRWRRKGHRV